MSREFVMGGLTRLIGLWPQASATDATSPALTPHMGHVAAWGALISGLLTGSHVRYKDDAGPHCVLAKGQQSASHGWTERHQDNRLARRRSARADFVGMMVW
jgi:hypothetical protein